MKFCRKCLNMPGSLTEMPPSQISVWSAAVGGHLWGMIFFAAVCILGGFLQSMTGKRPPLYLENNITLCMKYMSALVAKEDTKTCLGRLAELL